ncbi:MULTISPECIES: Fur family transcriptional regulator [unclassified Meridianimarinicoccus]|uniref:Fur family transcriptional regulator n=1 Tax=unclassified Meridianimarinicoccus TaxID=2923344 RepID=UPI001D003FA0|nr:Fur family transcriptional regulator [Fluviibacterium sp. MJW13]
MSDPAPPLEGFAAHDHRRCRTETLAVAERLSTERGLKLTPIRRRVLEILLEGHRALGAYDILHRLAQDGLGSQPPVAYRALNFLRDLGVVHRIEKLNAFVVCTHPRDAHVPAFLICRKCSSVAEASAPSQGGLLGAAAQAGFAIETSVLEAEGLCPDCQG